MPCSTKERWRRVALGLAVFAALASPSCKREKAPTEGPVDFIPSTANVIALVDYGRFARSDVLRRVFDVSQVEKILTEVGISAEDVLRVAGFARIDLPPPAIGGRGRSEDSPGKFGVIVQGKGGFGAVLKALSDGGWVHQQYEGESLWAAPEGNIAAALVGGDMLAVGTPEAVRQVVDVAGGKALGAMEAGSGNDCGAILRRIGTRGEINVAMSFSQEMRMAAKALSKSAGIFGGMTGANILGQLFEALGMGRGVGMSFAGTERGIASRMVFVVRDAAGARLLAGLVSVAKILIPRIGDMGQMQEAAEILRGLHAASENNLVLIDFKIPETILTRGATSSSHRDSSRKRF